MGTGRGVFDECWVGYTFSPAGPGAELIGRRFVHSDDMTTRLHAPWRRDGITTWHGKALLSLPPSSQTNVLLTLSRLNRTWQTPNSRLPNSLDSLHESITIRERCRRENSSSVRCSESLLVEFEIVEWS